MNIDSSSNWTYKIITERYWGGYTNDLGKGMNTNVLSPAIGEGKAWFFFLA